VLFAALRISPKPVPNGASSGTKPAAPTAEGLVEVPPRGCVSVPGGPESPQLSLPPGGVVLRAGNRPVEGIELRRFASEEFPVELEARIEPGRSLEIPIPPDRSSVPWKLEIASGGATTACGIG